MPATSAINTPERPGLVTTLPVAAATALYAGILLATNSSGYLVQAADTAGLRVAGRCEADVDNSSGSAGDVSADVKKGIFKYANSATNAVDADDIGKDCFVEDFQTVAETSTHKVVAGRVVAVASDGVWVDTRFAARVPSADTITGAADLAALKTALLAILQAQGLVK
ncbi:MAG TPA: hypothetical protein VIM61_00470 [Chthoniobacterales bacterium]